MTERNLVCVSYPAGSGGSFILSMLVSNILQDRALFKFDNLANCHPYKINYLRTYIPEEFDILKGNYDLLREVKLNPVVIYCQNIMPLNHSQNYFNSTKIVAIDYDTEDDLNWMLTNHFYKAEVDFDQVKQQSLDIWFVYRHLSFTGKINSRKITNLNQLPDHEVGVILAEYTRRYFRDFRAFGPGWKFSWNMLNGHDPSNVILLKFRDIMTNPRQVLNSLSKLIGPVEPSNITNYVQYLQAQIKFIKAKAKWLEPNCELIEQGLADLGNGIR